MTPESKLEEIFPERCCSDDGCRCWRGSCYGPEGKSVNDCPGECDGTAMNCKEAE